jgi:hypothetical protein
MNQPTGSRANLPWAGTLLAWFTLAAAVVSSSGRTDDQRAQVLPLFDGTSLRHFYTSLVDERYQDP